MQLGYADPHWKKERKYTQASDIFAMGVVILQSLTVPSLLHPCAQLILPCTPGAPGSDVRRYAKKQSVCGTKAG
jgi:hypothetical protein